MTPSVFNGINLIANTGGFLSWISSIDFKTFLSVMPLLGLQLIAKHLLTGFSTLKNRPLISMFLPIQSNSYHGLIPSIIILDLNLVCSIS